MPMSKTRSVATGCLVLSLAALVGCDLFDCESEKDDTRERWGLPEEVDRYDSDNYHSETWWYWSRGQSFTFTWGGNVRGGCDDSTYTFTPIS